MNYVYYMISSIIMDGAEDTRSIIDARKIAKIQAKRLAESKEYSHMSITIDKYNTRTHKSYLAETWKYDPGMDMFTRTRNCSQRMG